MLSSLDVVVLIHFSLIDWLTDYLIGWLTDLLIENIFKVIGQRSRSYTIMAEAWILRLTCLIVSFVSRCRAVSTVRRCHHFSWLSATDCSCRCIARLQVFIRISLWITFIYHKSGSNEYKYKQSTETWWLTMYQNVSTKWVINRTVRGWKSRF